MKNVQNLVAKQIKDEIKGSFEVIRKALDVREQLLLRQVDVLLSEPHKFSVDTIEFIRENEPIVVDDIRTFGKFNLDHLQFSSDLFVIEDYVCPSDDHDLMYKCLSQTNSPHGGRTPVELSLNESTLLKDNADYINNSIVNITMNEANALIEKSKLNDMTYFDRSDCELKTPTYLKSIQNKQISKSSQTEEDQSSAKNNLIIDNNGGTIHLQNISNVTINNIAGTVQKGPTTAEAPNLSKLGILKVHTMPLIEANIPKANRNEHQHPVQIHEWLKQIIYETDPEPVQNVEILEHSDIEIVT